VGWWSLIKCRVQTKMINMNFHGHGMYLPVLIIFFSPSLQCYFSLKTIICFCLTCVLGSQVYKGRYNVQKASRVKPVTTGVQKHCE